MDVLFGQCILPEHQRPEIPNIMRVVEPMVIATATKGQYPERTPREVIVAMPIIPLANPPNSPHNKRQVMQPLPQNNHPNGKRQRSPHIVYRMCMVRGERARHHKLMM